MPLILAALASCVAAEPLDRVAADVEIHTILQDLTHAWNARDAQRWVANFDSGSGFTNILGIHFDTREANQARHAQLFESIFSESTLEADILDLNVLGDDAAVAEVEFTPVGYTGLPPGIEETEPGELRTRLIGVLERQEGVWRIVAAQNTALLPLP